MTHIINHKAILESMQIALKANDPSIADPAWKIVEMSFPYSTEMKLCIQDKIYHAEGDVWTHNKMIAQNLYDRGSSSNIQLLTTLYHDVAKPSTRLEIQEENRIRISHPNHSRIGAQMAWASMWMNNVLTVVDRIQVYKQIQWHQRAYHIWKNKDMKRAALSYDCDANWNDMIEFALCDNLGRISVAQQETIDSLHLLKMWLEENNVIGKVWKTPASRIFYFEKEGRDHHYQAREPTGSNVILMSGLPGSGKDTYISNKLHGLPVVSLDSIRNEMKITHKDNQGPVIQAALELAKTYLRKKAPFVWNSTNLTKMVRSKVIDVCRAYDAYVSIHSMATDFNECLKGNKNRISSIPESAIFSMLEKWEPPSLTESHEIHWIKR